MKIGNIVSSFLVFALAIFIFISTASYPSLSGDVPGPAFFPRILVFVLILLGTLLLITTLINKDEDEKVDIISPHSIKIYITMGIMFIYIVVFQFLGFVIATPILLFILIRFFGFENYIKNILISLFVTFVIYAVFHMLLAVPIPMGILV